MSAAIAENKREQIMSLLQAYIVFQFELVPKWSIMIHAHNLPVYYPSLFCSLWYFNHIGAWFKRNNKTNGEPDFNSFHFSFDSTMRCIWVYFMCVWICIKCLETLKASQRHRHDRKWNVIRRQPSHSEFFNTGKTQQLCLSVWFYKAPGCTHVDNLMRYWDPAGEERHNGNTRQYTVWISFTKQRRRPHFTTTNEVLNRVAVGSWSIPQEAEPSGPVFWFVELVSSYIRFPVSICHADDDSCSHIITLHFP